MRYRTARSITTAAVFLCSILAVSLGMKIGHYSSAIMIKGIAGKASGLLLVLIGFYEFRGIRNRSYLLRLFMIEGPGG